MKINRSMRTPTKADARAHLYAHRQARRKRRLRWKTSPATTMRTNKQPASERAVAAATSAGGFGFPSPFPGNFPKRSCSKGRGDLQPPYQGPDRALPAARGKENLNCPFSIWFSSRPHPPPASSPFPQLPPKPYPLQQDGRKLSQRCGDGGKPQQPARQPPPQTPAPREQPISSLCGNGTPTIFWPGSSTSELSATGPKTQAGVAGVPFLALL